MLVSTLDGRIRLWDYLNSRPLRTYLGHANGKYCIASGIGLSPGSELQYVYSGSEDGKPQFWDVHTRKSMGSFAAHTSAVLTVDSVLGGSSFVTGSVDPEPVVKVWDMEFVG